MRPFSIRGVDPGRDREEQLMEFLRFGLVGASNAGVSFCAFYGCLVLLSGISGRAGLAQLFGYAAGTAWSFFWNRRFTFRSGGSRTRQAVRFTVLQALLAGLSALLIWGCVERLAWPAALSWIMVMVPVTIANFLACKYWAFAGQDAGTSA